MAKRSGSVDGMLISPTGLHDFAVDLTAGDVNMDSGDGCEELSLEEILTLYSQPINEEQAWAVCYQCCRTLAQKNHRRSSKTEDAPAVDKARRIDGPSDVRIRRDGTVKLHNDSKDKSRSSHTTLEVIESLGIMIYKALDYGLKESEERELSPPLERLIDLMANAADAESDPCPDEGYEATEEEDEADEGGPAAPAAGGARGVCTYQDVIMMCSAHLPNPCDAPNHYQAVCRALYTETRELRTFLEKIKNAKENLRKMGGGNREDPAGDLNELQNADWANFWVQVMRDLRNGVKLKKVQERQYNPLAFEYQLTPYEMLMDDIRSKRYKLRKVMVNGDIPPRLKKGAHEAILEFIRSRPPLNPASARKLKPYPERPRSLHELLLEGIKSERKLRAVSPDVIRRHRLVPRPLSMSCSFDSGAGKSISTPQDLFRSSDTPDAARKLAGSTQSLASGGTQPLSQRKRLLKAPTLAELDSSTSDDDVTQSSSSISASIQEDSSPEPATGEKVAPSFLPASSASKSDKRQLSDKRQSLSDKRQLSSSRRHSIGKDVPASGRPFGPVSRQKTLVDVASGAQGGEEFCYPVECLALTVEEVMHIRQVLVKAELEKFQQYKDIYNALKKGKLCFSCRTKRFSLFTWSYSCQFCKRPVCFQCCKKMRLPSKPYAKLPIYSLGPSAMSNEETSGASAPAEAEKASTTSGHGRHSLRRTVYKLSKHSSDSKDRSQEGPELPKELTEDWATMEVCVDCRTFIADIISSSRRSLSVASKRARLNRKTQSFYVATSSKSTGFRPTERTINEV